MGIDKEKGFDPEIAANISKEKKKGETENPGFQNIVYDPVNEKSDVLEDLPFGGNQGNLIVEKGGEKSLKIAKAQTLPLTNILEDGKGIELAEESYEEEAGE